jgi:hypothetical protein
MKADPVTSGTITFSPDLAADDALASYWMRQVTLRLRREICWIYHEWGLSPRSNTVPLPATVEKAATSLNMSRYWEEKRRFFGSDPTAGYLTEQISSRVEPGAEMAPGGFGWAVNGLGLDDAASFVLALGLAVAFDSAVGSVIALCLNDLAMTRPSLSLAQRLWDEPEAILAMADSAHPLYSYGLLQLSSRDSHHHSAVDWDAPLGVPAVIARNLLFPDCCLPEALRPMMHTTDDIKLPDDALFVASRIRNKAKERIGVVPVRGPIGAPHRLIAGAIGRSAGRLVVEFAGSPALLKNPGYVDSLLSLCWLRDVDLFIGPDYVSAISKDGQHPEAQLVSLQSIPITILLGITDRSQLAHIPERVLLPIVDVPTLSYPDRCAYWKTALGDKAADLDDAISECSRRFRYERGAIDLISEGLKGLGRPIEAEDLITACRAELELDMGDLAQKVAPRFENESLILPAKQQRQFREIIKAMTSLTEVHYGWGTAKAWNEGGISVLFTGPPGTGKTMAAETLAIKLDLPMYRIDLSQVVNKYIGETEKNLKKLFDAADISDLILFFDEADALFGKRTEVRDSHDRYANLEISYLLERMERFKGLAILATNHKKDLDTAFLRRLRFIMDFPLPGIEQRRQIFRQVVPEAVDDSEIDFDFLARQFPLAGGHIRSIVFNACLQSADGSDAAPDGFKGRLRMEDMIVAVKREYDKLNRQVSLEHFGPYGRIVEAMEHGNGKNQS